MTVPAAASRPGHASPTDEVVTLELGDPRWLEFVAAHPQATPFHHPDWARLVAQCYRFRSFAVAIRDRAGALRAGLPLIEVRHLRGKPKWVSLPFTDHCPPLLPGPEEQAQLAEALLSASAAAGVRRVEVRAPIAGAPPAGPPALRHVLALDADPAAVYAGFHRSQVQRSIRRAERESLTVRRAERESDVAGTFYRLHLQTRQRQGVPVQPRRFFRLLWDGVIRPGLGSVLIAEAEGRPVAAAVFLSWNGTVIYKFGASDASSWRLRPNHLLFWHAIRAACEQGYQWFDFGRTDAGHDGLRDFKLSWGATEETLVYSAPRGAPQGQRAPGEGGKAAAVLESAIKKGPPLLCRAAGEMLYRYTA
jgi:CelD/BcsL family acetyltransferase involved in cellulose biosynthesis